ncbi:GNAT family N-acetyltransferase [Rhizobium sp. BG4]|uniref:GNAT family N-acetyltransferase n=1 Tax=Rhizobium sp. BG4 TaxID=2613770 RepID=UPI00193D8B28|nr:GNAT family N-acetyltransferase [Rhizobium sp. BG4]QRM42684.1 GNAT family N-acetyltransferase [Rhizobium sp. BG4]
MPTTSIDIFDADTAARHLPRFSDILIDSVEGGALVGHVIPVNAAAVASYWEGVFASVGVGERLLICATVDGEIVGTVQLYLSPEPNAPHRGEVYKLLVHPTFRNRGIGEALMKAVEVEARNRARTLLLLDTVQGGPAERLYGRLGWQAIGVVPRHFVDPWGELRSSVYMMRFLDSEIS